MRNIKLTLEYDGTAYAGWQRQKNSVTIQQVIEEVLGKLTGDTIQIIGSGRTDSGVHARGQVANFHTAAAIPPERFSYALNALLPKDIRILQSEEVPSDFHARFSVTGKEYRYAMLLRPHGTALGSGYVYHIRPPIRVPEMQKACSYLSGTWDFAAFQAAGASSKTTVRTIHSARLEFYDPYLYFIVAGNGFLYNMVRIIVGTLIDIGKGKRSPEDMAAIIASGDRSKAGPTAPPHGLSLEAVFYENTP